MAKFGIKVVTYENWLSPDPLMNSLMMSGKDWLESILEPQLKEIVPLEICKLFEVARDSMLYGYFFYPLFTLALEQLFRVAETAVSEKCNQLTVKKIDRNNFIDKLNYLRKAGVLSDEEYSRWNALRNLRNIASHPGQQAIFPPGVTLKFVFDISELINALFAPKSIEI